MTLTIRAAIAAAAFLVLSAMAIAATPVGDPPADAAPKPAPVAVPAADTALDTELVVRNWVLCASQSVAEDLVRAGERGRDAVLAAFAALKAARACGQFTELRVILKEPVFHSAGGTDATVFSALVNLAGGWASGFVVAGGLPER